MKLAPIVPDDNLELTVAFGYHMALAGRLEQSPKYREWFKRLHSWGHFIIVDNGASEGADIRFEDVMQLADYVGADEICLPDVLYDGPQTLALAEEWSEKVPRRQQLMIPQGKTWLEYLVCGLDMCKMNPATIGLNRAPLKQNVRRAGVLDELRPYHLGHFHAMGIWKDIEFEVEELRGRVRGLDTGVAAAYAQHGYVIGDPIGEHVSVEHDQPCGVRRLRQNLNILRNLCNGGA